MWLIEPQRGQIQLLHTPIKVETLNVLVATPAGGAGQGGIDRIMGALRDELATEARPGLNASFAATRGRGSILASPAHLLAFCTRMLAMRAVGRLDLVHINLASDGSTYRKLLVARLARTIGVPYLIHLHGGEYREFWDNAPAWLDRQIRAMFEAAAQVIVLGRVWAEFVTRHAPGAADRIVIVPNATRRPQRPHVGGGDKVHILFLGNIGDRKGVPQLGEALHRMKSLPGWRATMAGDGQVEAARRKAIELGLAGRVEIPGWVNAEGVADLIAHADVLVLPSFAENLPMSVIEGMGAGLAVVTTPVGAVEDIITDNETGLLVPPGDVDALTAALTRVVTDGDLRRRLGETAMAVHRERLDLVPYARTIADVWRMAAR
jgi:glycosyltransferase involved in cell wall biosynthesis